MKTLDELLKRAKEIAEEAHKGQTRWHGEPAITHPEAVAKKLEKHDMATQAVAWLYDVVEDNPQWTLDRLRSEGFFDFIIEAVDAMTHREGETYFDYIMRVKKNLIARAVKQADIEHNLSTSEAEKTKNKRMAWQLAQWVLGHSCYNEMYGNR